MDEQLTESIRQRLAAIKQSGQTVEGAEVLFFLQCASQAGIKINTPTGKWKQLPAVLVGMDRQSNLYFSFSHSHRDELLACCRPGYRVHVSIICERGLGAMVHFDSVIEQVGDILLLATTKVPKQVVINQIRKETRYPVALSGWTTNGDTKIPIELTDLSFDGCAFTTSFLSPPLKTQQPITLRIQQSWSRGEELSLSGMICNQRKLQGNFVYGMKFDQDGRINSRSIFMQLEFNGQMMVAKQPTQVLPS